MPPPYKRRRMVGSGGLEPPRACARGRRAADYPTTRRMSWGERPESNRLERVSQTRGAPFAFAHHRLVAGEGIEPPCAVCRTAVLPLNEPAVGRGGGNRTRISRLMRPPRSPSPPSAAVGQPLLILPLNDEPSWRGQRDSNPYSRADNAASFPSTMSPSGWSQRWDSNPHESALEAEAFSRV